MLCPALVNRVALSLAIELAVKVVDDVVFCICRAVGCNNEVFVPGMGFRLKPNADAMGA